MFLADLLLLLIGTGAWQVSVLVALAMTVTLLLNAGTLFVTQAAVQGIVVVTLRGRARLRPDPLGRRPDRWRRGAGRRGRRAPGTAAASARAGRRRRTPDRGAAAGRGARAPSDGDVERGLQVLADARNTDRLIRELQDAADEGLSVLASSPFRRRHVGHVRRMVELVEPLDRALRNTRVLVRRIALASYHHQPLPRPYVLLCEDLADVVDEMADELAAGEMAGSTARCDGRCCASARAPSEVERVADLSADVVLAQIRSIIVDLLQITGMDVLEATDALPPPAAVGAGS